MQLARDGRKPLVIVGPMPDGYEVLDPESDFTLNALAQESARLNRLGVVSDYIEGDDVPERVRKLRTQESVPGRIY